MLQNLTEVILDRKQNNFILIYLIIGLLNIYFSNLESQNRVTLGKKLCLYPCTCILILRQFIVLHSPKFGILLETNNGVFDVASGES